MPTRTRVLLLNLVAPWVPVSLFMIITVVTDLPLFSLGAVVGMLWCQELAYRVACPACGAPVRRRDEILVPRRCRACACDLTRPFVPPPRVGPYRDER